MKSKSSFITKGVALAAVMLLTASPVFAKEITSGGTVGTGVPVACNPVSSLTAKGDPRVGETGLASIDVSYSVKPCVNGQAVTAQAEVYEYLTGTSAYLNPAAPLNGKFTAFGIKVRTSYIVKITVYDATTGAVVGSQSVFAAAIPKGV
jgi:hypothetical protein